MPEKFQCEIVTLDRIYHLCADLAKIISNSGYRIDLVVAIARGGYVPARLLCDFLNLHQLTSIKVEHYMATEKNENALLKYPLNADVKGKNVLLVDDVNDTGKSIKVAIEHIRDKGAADVKVATMHEKKGSAIETDFHVEYLDTWRWLIYEWAVVEDVGSFVRESGLSSKGAILDMLNRDYGLEWSEGDLEKILPFINANVQAD